MSKISIEGNASGTGTLTIAAPNTNTNRTLTLPDNTGTLLTTATDASSIPGYGSQILVADQWRITANTDVSFGSTFLTTNWERIDTDSPGTIGTAMSESSGVFTFPSTGKYLIQAILAVQSDASSLAYAGGQIYVTEDDSTYTGAAANLWGNKSANEYTFSINTCLFNVTNTTTHKMKLRVEVTSATQILGNSADNGTSILFLRLGS